MLRIRKVEGGCIMSRVVYDIGNCLAQEVKWKRPLLFQAQYCTFAKAVSLKLKRNSQA